MIDYPTAKVVKLLSRIILQVNGAIDAMNKEGTGDLLPLEKKVTRSLMYGMPFSAN